MKHPDPDCIVAEDDPCDEHNDGDCRICYCPCKEN